MQGFATGRARWGAPSFIQEAPEFLRDESKQNVHYGPRHLNVRARLIWRSAIAGREPERVVKMLSDGCANGFIDLALRLGQIELGVYATNCMIHGKVLGGGGRAGRLTLFCSSGSGRPAVMPCAGPAALVAMPGIVRKRAVAAFRSGAGELPSMSSLSVARLLPPPVLAALNAAADVGSGAGMPAAKDDTSTALKRCLPFPFVKGAGFTIRPPARADHTGSDFLGPVTGRRSPYRL